MIIDLPQIQMQGFFTVSKAKADADGNPIESTRVVVMEQKPNLITDIGLEMIGRQFPNTPWGRGIMQGCVLGGGSRTPAVGDQALQAPIVGNYNGTYQQDLYGQQMTTAPYYGWRRRTYRFPAGAAGGNYNISEIGITQGFGYMIHTDPTYINVPVFSRSLTVDQNGNPSSISVLSDEVLDVTYELRNYLPTADRTGTLTFSGEGFVSTYRIRTVDVSTSADYAPWGYGIDQGCENANFPSPGIITTDNAVYASSVTRQYYDDAVVAPDEYHYYNWGNPDRPAAVDYVQGTRRRDFVLSVDLNWLNWAKGIGSIIFPNSLGVYRVNFGTRIPKTEQKKLSITFRQSWARRST